MPRLAVNGGHVTHQGRLVEGLVAAAGAAVRLAQLVNGRCVHLQSGLDRKKIDRKIDNGHLTGHREMTES